MRYGFLFVLVFATATGLAHGQGPFAGPYPGPNGPGPMVPPPGYYPPPYNAGGYPYPAYPPPYPYQRPPGMVPGPYNPYPISGPMPSPYNPPTPEPAQDNPGLPAPPVPAAPAEPCEPVVINKLGSSCGSGGGCLGPSWNDCLSRPNQAPGGYCFYGRVEVLYWWLQNQSVGGLTNTGNISGTTVSVSGFSFDARTAIPDYNDIIAANHLGLRFTNGVWLDQNNTWAIETNCFAVLSSPSPYYATGGPTSTASPSSVASLASLLGLSQAQTANLLKGLSNTNVVATVGFFGGAELNLRHEICRSEFGHLDWLIGARYLNLTEDGGVMDSFGSVLAYTQNQYIGGQVGLEGEVSHGRLFLDGVGKVSLGTNHEIVSMGTTASAPANLASLVGNQGVYNRDAFAAVGEIGVTAGVRLGCNTRLFANYTLIYLTDAVRPLPEVSPYLGGARPNFTFASSSFWAQGASVGLEFRF